MPTYIVLEKAPDISHIRSDETFTYCDVWLVHPFQEIGTLPEGTKECGTCKMRWKKANDVDNHQTLN